MLYEVFESARSSGVHPAITTQATAETWVDETFNLAEEMSKLQLAALGESATRKISKALDTLRFFDIVFQSPYRYFSIALKAIYPCLIPIKFSPMINCRLKFVKM